MSDPDNARKINRLEKSARRRSPAENAGRPEPSVNMEELRELIALLRDNGLSEFELEREGFRVRLRRGFDFESREMAGSATSGQSQPATVPPPPVAPVPVT